jgi:serine/threonine-protein kinase
LIIGANVGKYRVVAQLGRGTTGIVYRAVDETLDRDVAIRALNPDLAGTDIIKRFRTEAATLAKLSHSAIATIYEVLRTDSELLVVMELVGGETLDKLSQRLGAIPPDRAAYLVDRILSALEHAHRIGVVHRDMKPANVMVTELGAVKIMDFGIARVRAAEHMTVDGCTIGTRAYMPLEQVLGEEVDGRSDLYSVGVIFYRLLTGVLPFDADTPVAMLQKQAADTPTPLHVHRSGLPDWCETVEQRALSKAPDDRFQSAEEFRATLVRAMSTATTTDHATAFAFPASESTDSAPEPGAFQTLPISRTQVPSVVASDVRPSDVQQSNKTLIGPDFTTIALSAKQFARRWEFFMLMGVAALATLAYSSLGGSAAPGGSRVARIVANVPTPVTFQTKALLDSGTRQRERAVTLLLAEKKITVTPHETRGQPLYSVPYERVLSVTYTRGTDPMWKSPKGAAPVVRSRGGTLGKFGIFVVRHWIVLQTNMETRFVVLRVEEEQARRVLTAIAERSGRIPENIVSR